MPRRPRGDGKAGRERLIEEWRRAAIRLRSPQEGGGRRSEGREDGRRAAVRLRSPQEGGGRRSEGREEGRRAEETPEFSLTKDQMANRLLFASIHSYLDPSSGAALATRELLELLAARGWDCRALTCGVLDYQHETPLDDVLAALERPAARVGAALSRGGEAEVLDLELDGVRVTLLPTAFSRAERAPSPREAAIFLDLAEQVLERFRPQVLLTYGGHPVSLELMRRARARGIAGRFPPAQLRLQRSPRVRRRLGGDLPLGVFAAVIPAPDRAGRNGDPVPDPARPGCRRQPRAEVCDVHQPAAGQGDDGVRPDRLGAGPAPA